MEMPVDTALIKYKRAFGLNNRTRFTYSTRVGFIFLISDDVICVFFTNQ